MPATQITRDVIFRPHSTAQALMYAQNHGSYPNELYGWILSYHAETGGKFNQILDVGCGPGNVTRDGAKSFDHATGLDTSEAMIRAAKSIGGKTKSGEQIKWCIGAAEECSTVTDIGLGQVDLLTVATAAHWFDMSKFWKEAAKIVKPAGTVAIWVTPHYYCHPATEGAAKIQQILDDFELKVLAPGELSGSRIAREWYDDLEQPWGKADFRKDQFQRVKWNFDGKPSGPAGADFFGRSQTLTLQQLGETIETASTIERWRETHAGTDDCVKKFIADLKQVGGDSIRFGSGLSLLLYKRV